MKLHVTRNQRENGERGTVFEVTFRFTSTEEEQALATKYGVKPGWIYEITNEMKMGRLPLDHEHTECYDSASAAAASELRRMNGCDTIAKYLKECAAFGGEDEYEFSTDKS